MWEQGCRALARISHTSLLCSRGCQGSGWFGVVVVMRGLREELGVRPELPSIRVEGAGLVTGRPRTPNAVCVVDAKWQRIKKRDPSEARFRQAEHQAGLCGRFDLLHGDDVGSWVIVAAVNLLPSRQQKRGKQRRGEEGLGVWGKGPWGLMAPSPRAARLTSIPYDACRRFTGDRSSEQIEVRVLACQSASSAPAGSSPVSRYFHNATSSLRARATIPTRR